MISVVIPAYNAQQTIAACISSLSCQMNAGKWEVILVDSSDDATAEIASRTFPNLQVIRCARKTDPGTARTIGVEKAAGDIIAFIDADCRAAPDWLAKIGLAHKSGYDCVGGAVLNGNSPAGAIATAGYLAEFREWLPGRMRGLVGHIATCNASYKRFIFDTYGYFDGQYYPQEDLVFNYNLCEQGEKILFDPSIQVYHVHRSGLVDFLRHQYAIGKITAVVLKQIPLAGHRIVDNSLMLLASAPVLPLVKFLKTLAVFIRFDSDTLLRCPQSLPIFAVGLAFWMAGFVTSAIIKRG